MLSPQLGGDMRRREFITLLGGATVAWPLAAHAQQPVMPVVGFLRSTSLADARPLVAAFRQGLKKMDFVEGQNVGIEFRSAEDRVDRLPALVANLISRKVAVVVGNHNAALAAKSATITVPVIFVTGADPVRDGPVASLNRPGGNLTGVTLLSVELGPKLLELAHGCPGLPPWHCSSTRPVPLPIPCRETRKRQPALSGCNSMLGRADEVIE
jgi:putative ABC transport system substrate-binding protein